MSKGFSYKYTGTTGHIVAVADSLPSNPSTLLKDGWEDITNPQQSRNSNSREFREINTGLKVRFDRGVDGKTGFNGVDHYHFIQSECNRKWKSLFRFQRQSHTKRTSPFAHITEGRIIMKINEFLEKYCFHDSTIDEISYDTTAKELVLHMDFAFWMQKDYVDGTPENGMVNIRFHQVENYTGIIGKIDWFSVDNISLNPDHTITCVILDDFNNVYYEWDFYALDAELEDLYIDTTDL